MDSIEDVAREFLVWKNFPNIVVSMAVGVLGAGWGYYLKLERRVSKLEVRCEFCAANNRIQHDETGDHHHHIEYQIDVPSTLGIFQFLFSDIHPRFPLCKTCLAKNRVSRMERTNDTPARRYPIGLTLSAKTGALTCPVCKSSLSMSDADFAELQQRAEVTENQLQS